jgi:TP901 family phage tail tape measure protein
MNIVEILVTAKNMTGPAFTEAKAGATAMESTMAKLNKTANLAALGLAGVGFEAVKMASKFDSEMSLLVTQAGVGEDKLQGLKKGVLGIAAKVGSDPDSLAEALFHVESNFESMGITSEKALKLTETAAKGAAIGHADLVDVTNALTAAVASGIPGVEDFDHAMGVLNATVGVGDMKMQDLANAFSSGMVATVKGFGLSITDVGAALAVFGDNNIRGSLAGNQLRMSVMALAKPISTSATALKTLGLTQTTLADDMQRGGLKLALEDLVGRMNAAGISADKQGQIITDAFGRKAGAGLNILVGQMDRLESKYPALQAGANGFGQAWERTQQTFSQQTKELEGSLQALMITLGEKLIPPLQKVTTYMLNNRDTMLDVAKGAGILITVLAGFSVLSKVAAGVKTLTTAYEAASTAMLAYKTRIVEAQTVSVAAGEGVSALSLAFGALSTKAKIAVSASAIGLLVIAITSLAKMTKSTPPDVDRMTKSLTDFSRSGVIAGELSKTFGENLEGLSKAVDPVVQKAGGLRAFFESAIDVKGLGADDSTVTKAKGQIESLDKALAGLVQGGHADVAAASYTRLQDALAAQGGDPNKLAGEFHLYSDALAASSETEKMATTSMGELGQQAMDTSKALDAQRMTATGLKDAIVDLNDAERAALDSQAGFEAAIDAASKAVSDNGSALSERNGVMDLSSEKARTEEAALTDLAAKTDAAAEAALNNGMSMDVVNGIYDKGRDKLMKVAQQMGLTRDQARELTESILQTPDKTAYLRGNIDDLKAKIAETDAALRNAKGEKKVQLTADKSQLEAQLAAAQHDLDALQSKKTVVVTTRFVTAGNGDVYGHGGFAHGGIVGAAAGGGARNGLTWVGEQGPELVRLPAGSTVHSNPDSQRMVAGSGGGGSAAATLVIDSAGARLDELLLELLRKSIRERGGNVQVVLGKG